MKLFLIQLLFLLISTNIFATEYYVATSANGGSDSNTGLVGQPVATLSKAFTIALAIGDTIHVGTGTFTEPNVCYPKGGISIVGNDTTNTIIKITDVTGGTTSYGLFSWIFQDRQYGVNPAVIRGIKFDGNMNSNKGLYIYKQNDFTIRDCVFTRFISVAVHWQGSGSTGFVQRGKFYNNIVYNSSKLGVTDAPTMSWGAVELYSAQEWQCYNNIIDVSARKGYAIKINGTIADKIHNNTLLTGDNDDDADWTFAIEYWNANGGSEIYNNTIRGCVDITGGTFTPGTYSYQHYIHDNVIGYTSLQTVIKHGMYIEGGTHYAIIENNNFLNVSSGIIIWTNADHASSNNTIQKNLFLIGKTGTVAGGYGIFQWGSILGATLSNYNIYNNTIVIASGSVSSQAGIKLPGNCTVTNWSIQNNIIKGFASAAIQTDADLPYGSITGLIITNNDFYDNGNSNNVLWNGVIPTSITNTANITTNPLFVSTSDFNLQSLSPAINAGTNVGLPYSGSFPDMGAFEYGITVNIESPEYKYLMYKGKKLKYKGKYLKY